MGRRVVGGGNEQLKNEDTNVIEGKRGMRGRKGAIEGVERGGGLRGIEGGRGERKEGERDEGQRVRQRGRGEQMIKTTTISADLEL